MEGLEDSAEPLVFGQINYQLKMAGTVHSPARTEGRQTKAVLLLSQISGSTAFCCPP